ncbi:hypothetical protein GCM10022200_15050 [Microbacterium awajiense]|uniref:Uncharacterized protein n=1 Tax=Microbacterium awajiense TaxID=415214 RepID=A0ABP7AHW0_9MICO
MSQSILPAVEPNGEDRATGSVSRRTLVKGAAWAVPVIALAAPVPVYAASECTPTTALDTLRPGTEPSQIVFQPSGVVAALAYSDSTPTGGTGATGEVAATSTNPSWNYIELEMTENLSQGSWVQLTITLSEPVEGLSFVLHDIDSVGGQWQDTVEILTTGYTSVNGGNVQGNGTAGNRFRPILPGDTPISSGLGDVRLTWPGPVQVVTLRYIAGITGDSDNQHIGVGDLSYLACLPGGTQRAARAMAAPQRHRISTGAPSFLTSDGSSDQ